MRRKARVSGDELAGQLAGLPALPRAALQDRWRTLHGAEPPSRLSRALLVRVIAYRLQEQALGGLKPTTRRWLAQAADDVVKARATTRQPPRKIMPGTKLLREWQGLTHEVTVLEDGLLFRGQRYRSLSEVARVITGSRWSGPLFFGLKAPGKRGSNG
jgi:hypothetical protein